MADTNGEHRHQILVVDDDPGVRDLFADVISDEGYGVAEAADGDEAIHMLEDGFRPCLILSDLRMPRMDGWELMHAVRRMDPELSVVVITSDKLLTFTSPAGDKPVAPAELTSLIRRTCTDCRADGTTGR